MTEEDFRKFYRLGVMKYYDCGGKYECDKAQQMIQNCGEKYIATWKNDGEFGRCLVDESHNVTFQSRNISKVTGEYGDKTASLPHLVEEAAKLPAQTVLLGELCFDDFKYLGSKRYAERNVETGKWEIKCCGLTDKIMKKVDIEYFDYCPYSIKELNRMTLYTKDSDDDVYYYEDKECTKVIKGLFKSKKARIVPGGTLIITTPYAIIK